jgi:uncharacterized membrane protein YkoI
MRTPNVCAFAIGITAALVAACGAPSKPAEGTSSAAELAPRPNAHASPSSEAPKGDLLSQLKNSKLTLAEGIEQAQAENGPATSAKFELEHGHLALSVYTAKAGVDKAAEHNVLMEVIGDPTKEKWSPKKEVFEDKAHVTRAATHLTLLQRAKTTLPAVIMKAAAKQPGTVYSVTPVVKDKKPSFDVLVATPDGKSVTITIDAS